MDISTEIAAIQAASEGSELRQPIVDALNALNSGTLPAVTPSDAGKILKVGANGWEVGEKSGYMPVPTAAKQITENGVYDVTDYASAVVNVSGGGGAAVLYTNSYKPELVTDVSGFTKIFNSTLKYGDYGDKVNSNLDLTDEAIIKSNMSTGWDSSNAAYYSGENLNGAYGGYEFPFPKRLVSAKFFIGRYSRQNKNLTATIEYKDSSDNWIELLDCNVSTSLQYPVNEFFVTIPFNIDIYGLRWRHYKDTKTSNNNLIFFGMIMYAASNIPVYIPDTSGLIEIPDGYDGFGALYLL